MLGKLFGTKKPARRGDDHVWLTDSDRRAGMLRQAERSLVEGKSVVLVALSAAGVDELAAEAKHHAPVSCRDVFGQGALRARTAQAGALTVALAAALPKSPAGAAAADSVPVEVLVLGRHDSRAADDEVAAFADSLGARAGVTFHLSFDDPLLARFPGGHAMKELLRTLGLQQGEAVAHAMVSRSIRKAQDRG
jgi:preprotein translocase subunit SecA